MLTIAILTTSTSIATFTTITTIPILLLVYSRGIFYACVGDVGAACAVWCSELRCRLGFRVPGLGFRV